MDNASSNTKFLEHLARTADFSESQPVRCFAHTTNLAVKDSLQNESFNSGISDELSDLMYCSTAF